MKTVNLSAVKELCSCARSTISAAERSGSQTLPLRTPRRTPARLCTAVLLLLFGAGFLSATPDEPITFKAADGSQHSLSELRGHPAVVNFWATWCGPCREEMPRLQKLSESYRAKGVQFVAISLDAPENQGKIPPLRAKRSFHLPVWTGATDKTLAQFELGVLVPATLILDEQGNAIGKIEGEARDKDIVTRLDWLLNGRTGRQPKVVQKNDW